jgi:RNA polymerase sigma-70 factor, ECF subfamily
MEQLSRETLYRELVPRIGRLRSYLASHIPASLNSLLSPDDLLQDIWVAADANVHSFRATGPDSIDRWLITIARSKLISAVRKLRSARRGGRSPYVRSAGPGTTAFSDVFSRLAAGSRTPSRVAQQVDVAHRVLIGLQRLAPRSRCALELFYLSGWSRRQVAQELGVSESTVKALLHRGREQMREVLGPATLFFTDARTAAEPDGGPSA